VDQEDFRVLAMRESEAAAVRNFLGAAFWGVGAFCAYWQTQVFIAALRFGEVNLPVVGRCSEMEAVIFTLTFGWLPLLILHLIVRQHQRLSGARPRFPGAMGGLIIPADLRWLRVLPFLALCLWPTFVHIFLTGRAFSHYMIVPSGFINSTLDASQWPTVSGWRLGFYPWILPADRAWEVGGARWWVNTREEWVEVKRGAQAALPHSKIAVETRHERVGITALSIQPVGFILLGGVISFSALALLVNGLKKRPTRDS
jgi:hypothetical protein